MTVPTTAQDTRFIYYIDEEETPYLVKLTIPPGKVTLGDFKNAINRPHSKFFFKSLDDDFGVVKEEIVDDNAKLPCFNGRVISWLVTADESAVSDSGLPNTTTSVDGKAQNGTQNDHIDPDSNGNRHKDYRNGNLPQTTAAPADSTSASIGNGNGPNAEQNYDTETESVHSANQDRIAPLRNFHYYKSGTGRHHFTGNNSHSGPQPPGQRHRQHHRHAAAGSNTYEAPSSMMSSDLESTSFFDSEDESSSRFSSITGTTLSSRRFGRIRQRRRRRRPPPISRASSFSSITDSTMSLNILAVTLNMDTVNFLGISIVGQSNKAGDGGIYVGSIMKGGAVAQDGRIEPGDMILEVNGISFEEMSNDDAVRTLREQVQRPGPITLVVAKCWDPNPVGGYFTIPRQEPVRPIDPRAWVLHTNAMTTPESDLPTDDQHHRQLNNSLTGASSGNDSGSTLSPTPGGMGMTPGMSMGTLTSGQTSMPLGTSAAAYNMAAALLAASQQQQQQQQQQLLQRQQQAQLSRTFCPRSNVTIPHGYTQQVAPSVVTTSSSLPEIERYSDPQPLSLSTDVMTVLNAMLQPDSGLDIRDRVWLKLTVPNAFIGSDLVDWLYRHLDGFADRKDARKYACNLLKMGYIRHIVNKLTFSEQCYYVFRDLAGHMSCLSLEEVDSVSEVGAVPHHPHPNWSHNTTSTSLTVGPSNVGPTNSLLPDYNSVIMASNGMLLGGTVGASTITGEATTSSHYSSVPSAPVPLYHHQSGSASGGGPIHQLIIDGQNVASSSAASQTKATSQHPARILDKSRNISGYSSSSSSTSSELQHFKADRVGHNHPRQTVEVLPSTNVVNNNNNNNNENNNIKGKQGQDFVPASYIQQHHTTSSVVCSQFVPCITSTSSFGQNLSQTTTTAPTACSINDSRSYPENTTTSFVNGRQTSINKSDSNPLHTDMIMRDGKGTGNCGSSRSGSSSSSSSSTTTGSGSGHNQMRATGTKYLLSKSQSSAPPPPPPPRISTATSGFTLTSQP